MPLLNITSPHYSTDASPITLYELKAYGDFSIAGMEGPFALHIEAEENGIGLTFTNVAGASHKATLPNRPFLSLFRDRLDLVKAHHESMALKKPVEEAGTAAEARYDQHKLCTELLQKALAEQGVIAVDKGQETETARDLFAHLAELVGPMVSQGVTARKA